jgi:peptidase E
MPTIEDVTAHLLEQDVVWVFGGSVAGLLAMWRPHGVDEALRTAWRAGCQRFLYGSPKIDPPAGDLVLFSVLDR